MPRVRNKVSPNLPKNPYSLLNLSTEMIGHILSFVPNKSHHSTMSVCRTFHHQLSGIRKQRGLPLDKKKSSISDIKTPEMLNWAKENGLYPHDETILINMIIEKGDMEMLKIALSFYIERKDTIMFNLSYRNEFKNIFKEVISNSGNFHIVKWLFEEFNKMFYEVDIFNIIYEKYGEIKYTSSDSRMTTELLDIFKYTVKLYETKFYDIANMEKVVSLGLYEFLPLLHKDTLVNCGSIIGSLVYSRYSKLRKYDVDLCLKWLLDNNYSIPSNVSLSYLEALEHSRDYDIVPISIPKFQIYIMRKLFGLGDRY